MGLLAEAARVEYRVVFGDQVFERRQSRLVDAPGLYEEAVGGFGYLQLVSRLRAHGVQDVGWKGYLPFGCNLHYHHVRLYQ